TSTPTAMAPRVWAASAAFPALGRRLPNKEAAQEAAKPMQAEAAAALTVVVKSSPLAKPGSLLLRMAKAKAAFTRELKEKARASPPAPSAVPLKKTKLRRRLIATVNRPIFTGVLVSWRE